MVVQVKTAQADFISKKSRRELQEYFVGTSLREISQAFDDADFTHDPDVVPTEAGQRRGLVQQYYARVDFSSWDHVRRFLRIYADAMIELEQRFTGAGDEYAKRTHSRMLASIRKDGFAYEDGRLTLMGAVSATNDLRQAAAKLDSPYLARQIERIECQIDADPRLAIGTSKELIETVCKTILTDRGVVFDKKADLMDLMKLTRNELKLVSDAIPDSAKAADTIRKLLGNLGTIVQSIAELRNSYGTGHGHDGRVKGLSPRHARLAAGAACVLAKFLFETHEHRSE